jgi:hypothetical protein
MVPGAHLHTCRDCKQDVCHVHAVHVSVRSIVSDDGLSRKTAFGDWAFCVSCYASLAAPPAALDSLRTATMRMY